jgi:hypothetical protein
LTTFTELVENQQFCLKDCPAEGCGKDPFPAGMTSFLNADGIFLKAKEDFLNADGNCLKANGDCVQAADGFLKADGNSWLAK